MFLIDFNWSQTNCICIWTVKIDWNNAWPVLGLGLSNVNSNFILWYEDLYIMDERGRMKWMFYSPIFILLLLHGECTYLTLEIQFCHFFTICLFIWHLNTFHQMSTNYFIWNNLFHTVFDHVKFNYFPSTAGEIAARKVYCFIVLYLFVYTVHAAWHTEKNVHTFFYKFV